jgi:hypothetical protein
VRKARVEQTEHGLAPADEGWFILNVGDIRWASVEGGGAWCSFEPDSARSPLLGIGVHVLRPGEAPGYYHAECALLMVGTRSPDATIEYIVDPVAARHGVSVESPSDSPAEVYAGRPPIVPASASWPDE